MQLTAAFSMLSVISVPTLAFSWRRHDSTRSSPGVEYPGFQDLAIPGLLLTSRKTSHLFIVSQKLGSIEMQLALCIVGPAFAFARHTRKLLGLQVLTRESLTVFVVLLLVYVSDVRK